MQLPSTFPEGTEFLDVDGVPVTVAPGGECMAWGLLDSDGPEEFPRAAALRSGALIHELEFRELVRGNYTGTSPARLLAAAKDLAQREDAYRAALRAQGLTQHEIADLFEVQAAVRQAVDAEHAALRAIASARRRAREA